jgi:phosphate/phosphite/phosphonate ABC transporter binding protein
MNETAVFGYAARGASSTLRDRIAQFCTLVGAAARTEINVYEASSYEDLGTATARGEVDLAWLPPIPLVALERKHAVAPLVVHHRDGGPTFASVLVVRHGDELATPEDLGGTRAAWVDPYSASGYVVPRAALAALGLDPRVAFSEQRFWGSHEAAVLAVHRGEADVAATYGGFDESGELVRGAWLDVGGADEDLRVLARFGTIPGDVFAARSELPAPTRERFKRALLDVSRDAKNRLLLRDAFGTDALRTFTDSGYEELRALTENAARLDLLDAEETASTMDDVTPPDGTPVV